MTSKSKYEYLGDGLYVSFDGYQLELNTDPENIHPFHGNTVYLEPQVWENLVKFVERLKDKEIE